VAGERSDLAEDADELGTAESGPVRKERKRMNKGTHLETTEGMHCNRRKRQPCKRC